MDTRPSDEKAMGAEETDLKKGVATDRTEIDPALDKRITRQLDNHILPWIFILCSSHSSTGPISVRKLTSSSHD